MAEKGISPDKLAWHLQRNAAAIEVWRGVTKQQRVNFGNNNEAEIRLQANQGNAGVQTYFVEWVSNQAQPLTTTLTFEARMGNQVVTSDRILFYRFRTVVVVIGGRDQQWTLDRNQAVVAGTGIFRLARDLYEEGYDVHPFAQDEQRRPVWIATPVARAGSGLAYDEVRAAVDLRHVEHVVAMGFSWGGGAVFYLTRRLDRAARGQIQGENIARAFSVPFTAYIDAIQHGERGVFDLRARRWIPPAENRVPPLTQFHVNYYQQADRDWPFEIRGAPVLGANVNRDVNNPILDAQGRVLWHTMIDDSDQVLGAVRQDFQGRAISR
ncbi:MAG: hypothetical protein RMJ82_14900 [Gemmatales bacterium]|nr:hypothetical protein [Gemmatales bacterium]